MKRYGIITICCLNPTIIITGLWQTEREKLAQAAKSYQCKALCQINFPALQKKSPKEIWHSIKKCYLCR